MRDKALVLTTMCPRVDDRMKGSPVIHHALKRPGPAPQLSDSERIAIALSQEVRGEPGEDHVLRLSQASLQIFFPGLNERSRSTRRKRDRWTVILAVRTRVQIVRDALQCEETAAIDSARVPCVSDTRSTQTSDCVGTADSGVCSSTAMKSFGCTIQSVVGLRGVILAFLLTPASCSDTQPVMELLDSFPHHLTSMLGDGTSILMRIFRSLCNRLALCACWLRSKKTRRLSAPSTPKRNATACV